jgi:hypothetical protein
MLAVNTVLKVLDVSSNRSFDMSAHDGPGFAQELAVGLSDNGAMTSLNLSSNHMGKLVLLKQLRSQGMGLKDAMAQVAQLKDSPLGILALADAIKGNGALLSLNLSRNSIGADSIASITAALKRHAIEHQRPCISILLGDQDQHLLAHTKDLRALLVATSNLNPSHCMPAISAYLLKEIAEWL